MKRYRTDTKDTCWNDCIACLLEIHPSRVPNFVKKYGNGYMDATREWLAKNFNKGLIYIPVNCFMETGKIRNNISGGPQGYSIGLLSMVDDRAYHAIICLDGKVVWDNGDNRPNEYNLLMGYYLIYDMEPPKAKLSRKRKSRLRKKS